MDKPYLREIVKSSFGKPNFHSGTSRLWQRWQNRSATADKSIGAKPFAELYSPSFPDYVAVSSKGICHLPRYEFYSATVDNTNFVIMTGETQPSFDDVLAHYQVCDEIVDYVKKLGCQLHHNHRRRTHNRRESPSVRGCYFAKTRSRIHGERRRHLQPRQNRGRNRFNLGTCEGKRA